MTDRPSPAIRLACRSWPAPPTLPHCRRQRVQSPQFRSYRAIPIALLAEPSTRPGGAGGPVPRGPPRHRASGAVRVRVRPWSRSARQLQRAGRIPQLRACLRVVCMPGGSGSFCSACTHSRLISTRAGRGPHRKPDWWSGAHEHQLRRAGPTRGSDAGAVDAGLGGPRRRRHRTRPRRAPELACRRLSDRRYRCSRGRRSVSYRIESAVERGVISVGLHRVGQATAHPWSCGFAFPDGFRIIGTHPATAVDAEAGWLDLPAGAEVKSAVSRWRLRTRRRDCDRRHRGRCGS